MTRTEEIAAAVARLDVRQADDQDAAWAQLRPLGFGVVPFLRDAFAQFRTWQGRTALVYYSTRYARISEAALNLGLTALRDRSYMVRYRACGLLAYALNKRALPALAACAQDDDHALVRTSARAAMNAIKARNHNLFADHSLSGRTSWNVNPGDRQLNNSPPPLPSRFARIRLGIAPVPPA